MFENKKRELAILLTKERKCKSEQMSISKLQKWIVAVTVFLFFG